MREASVSLESAIFFETPEQIYQRVFRLVRPRTPVPQVSVAYCEFANANSTIRLRDGVLEVKVTDLLRNAPPPVTEALAWILLCKLYRKPVPRACNHRYRVYLNRRDVRQQMERIKRERGRKQIVGPQGGTWDLQSIFEDLNVRFFGGMMARPELGWSRRPSRTTLGHYDPSHHAIVLSSILDRPEVPRLAVEYVMFHEMLHLRFPVDHRGARRCVHTPEFKAAERNFPGIDEAREMLKRI
ncbi:MAG TPA: SprT-like domain-containing protein [Bryobacteraceae bacterium]|nr:SprT-like domain-containing protein [Bryobacteraceae bacterium]